MHPNILSLCIMNVQVCVCCVMVVCMCVSLCTLASKSLYCLLQLLLLQIVWSVNLSIDQSIYLLYYTWSVSIPSPSPSCAVLVVLYQCCFPTPQSSSTHSIVDPTCQYSQYSGWWVGCCVVEQHGCSSRCPSLVSPLAVSHYTAGECSSCCLLYPHYWEQCCT